MATIADMTRQMKQDFPNHCTTCTGRGGEVTRIKGDWCPDWIEIEPCEDCTEAGLDPLNTNLTLLEGGVSPTSGVDMVDEEREENLLPDLLAIESHHQHELACALADFED